MAEVVYRPYQEGDEVAINDGFNRVFSRQRSLEEWRWKFPAEPEGRWIMVAVDERGQVLAHYGATATRMRLGGVLLRGGQPVDVYSLPEVRGTRVFTNCYEEFIARYGNRDGLAVMYGFPGGKHYEMGLKQLKYVLLRPVPYWRRTVRRRWRLARWRFRVSRGFERAAAADLWRRAAARYPFATLKDESWFERRFTGRSSAAYQHLVVWRGGSVQACAVILARDGVLSLAELAWDGGDVGALAALDAELDDLARATACPSVETWLGGDATAEAALASLGWERCPEANDLHMVARCFHDQVDLQTVAERFYLTMGDADLV
ncbi:MAG: GNAT family N-acetyltransferase [Thermoanaerobaculales bacterium]